MALILISILNEKKVSFGEHAKYVVSLHFPPNKVHLQIFVKIISLRSLQRTVFSEIGERGYVFFEKIVLNPNMYLHFPQRRNSC